MKTSKAKRAALKRYYYSETGKAFREQYKASGKRKEVKDKYKQSKKGRAAIKRYRSSEKHKDYRKKWNKTPTGKAVRAKASKKIHDRKRAIISEEKLKRGCVDCGYKGHPAALDFDHVKGKKLFSMSQAVSRSIKAIRAEMEKCVVRCSNCHRIKTFEDR